MGIESGGNLLAYSNWILLLGKETGSGSDCLFLL